MEHSNLESPGCEANFVRLRDTFWLGFITEVWGELVVSCSRVSPIMINATNNAFLMII